MVRFIFLTTLIFLTACASDPHTTSMNVDLSAVNANATLQAVTVLQQAASATAVQATAVAGEATRQAYASQTAVAAESTRQAVSTRESLAVQQTAVALQMSIDDATRSAQATSTAVAVTIASEQALAIERQENTDMLREAESRRLLYDQILRGVIVFALVIFLFAVALIFAYRVRALNARPVQQTPDGLLIVADGLFRHDVRRLTNGSAPTQEAPKMLPSPRMGPAPVAPVVQQGNLLIAGESGSGKSTTMEWLTRQRQQVTVLDPDNSPGDWPSADRVISDYGEISEFFGWMLEELERRKAMRNRGEQREFTPMTVATDELPAIRDALGSDEANSAWPVWVRRGRKYGLWVIVSTQSTRVKTLGISGEGDLIKQFHGRFYLGKEARINFPDLVGDEERAVVYETETGEAQAVTIPYDPPRPVTPPQDNRALIIGDETVTGEEVDQITRLLGQGVAMRQIAYRLYGSHGGPGFYRVQAVKNYIAPA